jgi:CDP-paratose 2-epimerase
MKDTATRTILITGGAGFVGSNLAERLMDEPDIRVRVLDNLSRRGVERNIHWLQSLPNGKNLEVIHGDIRDAAIVRRAVKGAAEIYHLAAQVAVTTSLDDPASDFEVNMTGTFNVLEAARSSSNNPLLIYTSTNKVYGSLQNVPVEVEASHYKASDPMFGGVDEKELLDFHSPYGCSKGAADQYVRDYARVYDLPTVVFRMSCIAGPRQFGNEDQGWVAHFLYSVLSGQPITVYGNGYQVRDVLHVYDLIDAVLAARSCIHRTRGEIYNLGGGMRRVISVVELLQRIEKRTELPLKLEYRDMRAGDQPLYISDTSKFERHTGWKPSRSLDRILDDIEVFWRNHRHVVGLGSVFSHEVIGEILTQEVA